MKKFLGNDQAAKRFDGGALMVFRLAPYHYHRFHFPFDCVPGLARRISGGLDSVNPVVYKNGHMPLLENERILTFLQSERFGSVAMVSVGALAVGRITNLYDHGGKYKKGDEMGYFSFGGSTIVLLFEKDKICINEKILENSTQNIETSVLMGEGLFNENLSVTNIE